MILEAAKTSPRLWQLLGAITLGFVFGGCAVDSSVEPASNSIFDVVLAEAREGGAGPEQLDVLERAAEDEELSLEDARESARRTVQCISDSGFNASYVENRSYSGNIFPGYTVTADIGSEWEDIEARVEQCDVLEGYWVNQAYQTQATSLRANEEFADELEQVIRACLEDKGFDTDPTASGSELADRAVAVAPDCLGEAGIDSW